MVMVANQTEKPLGGKEGAIVTGSTNEHLQQRINKFDFCRHLSKDRER